MTVNCAPASIQTGQTSQCSATLTGTGNYNLAVSWTVDNGAIDQSGKYTAPASATVANVTATSVNDGKSGAAQITVSTPPPTPTSKVWTWMRGSNTRSVPTAGAPAEGVYGTLGVAAASNVPGGRSLAVNWIDKSGKLWLFGGQGFDSNGIGGDLNDLWEYDPASNMWTWMGGSSTEGATGFYGIPGVANAHNIPGGRWGSVSWVDGSGNLWLFGGGGIDSTGVSGYLNDLWEYNPTTKTWTWMNGPNTNGGYSPLPGVYGTQGVPAAGNIPGGRDSSVGWIDGTGNLWLFGGDGVDFFLNDLWEYSPTSNMWTWMGGDMPGIQAGVYGTQGTPAASNVPGGRVPTAAWTDSSGSFWLMGGIGYDSTGKEGYLDDLWWFDPTFKMWTWMGGSNSATSAAINYGTQGVPAASNLPGGRVGSASWVDSKGNLGFFGGLGYDSTGTLGYLNDLWEFNPTASTPWTWMSGSSTVGTLDGGQSGIYGTQGVAAASNVPGGRTVAVSWIDASGNLWLFGGFGFDSNGELGYLNDLWQYQP